MKTTISIPDGLFHAAENAATRLGLSRSQFYQRALTDFLERRNEDPVREALHEVYGTGQSAALDPVLERMQRLSLPREEW